MATEQPSESPVIKSWKAAVASFRKSIPHKGFEQIQQSTSPQDVVDYIESVQKKERGKNSKTVLAIKACVHRLQRFGGVLDVLAQGASQPGCLVWGSIKFALTVLIILLSSFEVFAQSMNNRFRLLTTVLKNSKDFSKHLCSSGTVFLALKYITKFF